MKKDQYEKGIERAKTKNNLKSKIQIIIISLIVILIVILGILLVVRSYEKLNKVTYDKYPLYQYFSGVKYEYNGIVTIERQKDITNIKSEGINVEAGYIPIYFQNSSNVAIFPTSMELVFPKIKTKSYRINYFSKIEIDVENEVESATLDYNGNRKLLEQCFLYNGEDLYFFPYSTSVVIENETYELSPLSYITVLYKNQIEIYDKASDKYTIIETHNNDVIATVDGYKVNLSTDMIMYDKDNRLLIKNVDKLDLYK